MDNRVNTTTYQSIGGKKMTAKPNAKAPLGQGGRFAALKAKIGREKGVTNPGAVAASIGRKKLGNAKMTQMAVKGRMNEEGKAHEKTESKAKEAKE